MHGVVPVGGDEHHLRQVVRLDLAHHVQSGHVRHLDVQEHDLGRFAPHELERGAATAGLEDLAHLRPLPQQRRQGVPARPLVIGHEHHELGRVRIGSHIHASRPARIEALRYILGHNVHPYWMHRGTAVLPGNPSPLRGRRGFQPSRRRSGGPFASPLDRLATPTGRLTTRGPSTACTGSTRAGILPSTGGAARS